MDDYRNPPSDPKVDKGMAMAEQKIAKEAKEEPLRAAEKEIEIIEAVVVAIEAKRPPSRFRRFFRRLARQHHRENPNK